MCRQSIGYLLLSPSPTPLNGPSYFEYLIIFMSVLYEKSTETSIKTFMESPTAL